MGIGPAPHHDDGLASCNRCGRVAPEDDLRVDVDGEYCCRGCWQTADTDALDWADRNG
jgi:formylmethanofuran dehydrogenase subunit E